MVFSGGVLTPAAASQRFDEMLHRSEELAFAKQPVVEAATGVIVGYCGCDWFDLKGERRLELGYRLTPEARGRGFATEAGQALLELTAHTFRGDLFTIIHPSNAASAKTAEKLGFRFWMKTHVDGQVRDISRLEV